MKIITENLGKRFNYNWIFRNINLSLSIGDNLAIIGANGSGKSTLLQILSGAVPASEGKIKYFENSSPVSEDTFFKYISLSTPYLELIEEFTLNEILDFHFQFKKLKEGISKKEIKERMLLDKASHREIRFFSSGMKQRVKLGLAFFSDTPLLFLDEPTANLDQVGINWYLSEIKDQLKSRVVVIASNQDFEYDFCQKKVLMGKMGQLIK